MINELCKLRLSNSRLGVAYFYSNGSYSRTQEPRIILGSLCRQLLLQLLNFEEGQHQIFLLHSLHRDHKLGRITRNQILSSIRNQIITLAFRFPSVHIIIDGLDELNSFTHINELLQLAMGYHDIKILIASRSMPSVENALQQFKIFQIEMNEITVSADIAAYIDWRLKNDAKFRNVKSEVQTMIREELLNKSNGM